MGYNEMQSLTINGNRYDSFPDHSARESLAEKLPKPRGSSAVGQILAVGEVDIHGTIWDVRPIDLPESTPYELPVGGDVLGGVKNGGNVVIGPDGTMTVDGAGVGEEALADAVSQWLEANPDATTTVQDGAITTEKLADHAVTTGKLEGMDRTEKLVPWELFLDGYNTNVLKLYKAEDSAIYSLHLEAGKTYYVGALPYPTPVNVTGDPSYPDNTLVGYYAGCAAPLSVQTLISNNKYYNTFASGIWNTIAKKMYTNGYITDSTDMDWSQNTGGSYFTMLADVWIYRAARKPDAGMFLNNMKIFETDPGEVHAPGANTAMGIFKFDLGEGYATDGMSETAGRLAVMAQTRNDRVYAAMSRDVPRDRSLRIVFIGDSITFGGGNAGLQHAFRKYVSMNLNAPQTTYCQPGVSVTTGSGSYDWKGGTGGGYDSVASGYAGLVGKLPKTEAVYGARYLNEGADIVIVELGTNDFWEGAPLGSVSDLTDDTTFYGAVEKTLTLLEDTYPNAQILWVLPFKNSRWTEANSAGNTLVEYLIALKILCQTHRRVWVLDLFDKWYLDYDNQSVRNRFFNDQVHPSGNAHKCVAEAIIDKIRQIVSIAGLKRIEQPALYNSNDSRYGA